MLLRQDLGPRGIETDQLRRPMAQEHRERHAVQGTALVRLRGVAVRGAGRGDPVVPGPSCHETGGAVAPPDELAAALRPGREGVDSVDAPR